MATTVAEARARDIRVDLLEIGKMVESGSRVLDIGCGDGDLLYHLVHDRRADARGMEISREGVNACVARGLSVVQGDADRDLADYPTGAFDYAILSQTLQAMRDTRAGLEQMLRIGRRAIVSFPNFGFWRVRLQLLFAGRMPDTATLQNPWYNTPNIHLCTIRDFISLCTELGVTIERFIAIDAGGKPSPIAHSPRLANLLAEQALFLLSYDGKRDPAGAPVYSD
ncbi:MAG: methionine biosynthesis protein MetW [Alphaproteobacteria bacterium]|nr:methionine biosynthesis protein MetW [Alphaproteobacteria bacterium]